MEESLLRLGRRIKAARILTGFDEADFAIELGIPLEHYRRIELGAAEPSLAVLVTIARLAGKSLDFMLTGRAFVPEAADQRSTRTLSPASSPSM